MVEIVVGLFLAGGAWRGFNRGLLREIVSLLGFAVALFIANQRHGDLAPALGAFLGRYVGAFQNPTIARVAAFVVIALAVLIVASLLGEFLHRLVGLLFLGFPNRMGGLLFGLLEAALLVELALVILLAFSPSIAAAIVAESRLAASLLPYAPLLFALLPWEVLPLPVGVPQLL